MVSNSQRRRESNGSMAGEGPVEIVIRATDKASSIFKQVGVGLVEIVNQLDNATLALEAMGAAAIAAADSAVGGFLRFVEVLRTVQSIIESEPVQALWQTFSQGFDQMLSQVNTSLTQGLSGIVSGVFGDATAQAAGSVFGRVLGQNMAAKFAGYINQVDQQILGIAEKIESAANIIPEGLGYTALLGKPLAGDDEVVKLFNAYKGVVQDATSWTFQLTQEIGMFSMGLSALQQFVTNGPFNILIDQNIRLREQLLSTQSTLAATNDVMVGGAQLKDPTAAIQSLAAPVERAIAEVRRGSLDLVGVTSKDLISVYEIVSGQISSIGGDLSDAADLTLDFSSAMGTLQIPLDQSRQEINSIIQGQITSDSYLAKAIGLTSQQVQMWRQQGVVVERLREKLEAFRAGNALAAQTIGGISSNIQEVFDEIFRRAGEPLIDPIVKQLGLFYKALQDNSGALTEFVGTISEKLLIIVENIISIGEELSSLLGESIGRITLKLFDLLAQGAKMLKEIISNLIPVLQPFVNAFEQLIAISGGLSPFLKFFAQFKLAEFAFRGMTSAFGQFAAMAPVLGDVMALIGYRTNGVLNSFLNLKTMLGTGGAGFLMVGKYLEAIPGAAGAVTSALGPLGPLLIGFVPSLAGVGIGLTGLVQKFPVLKNVIVDVTASLPGALNNMALLARNSTFAGGALKNFAPFIEQASVKLREYGTTTGVVNLLNEQFAKVTRQAAEAAKTQILQFGFMAAAAVALFFAIDELILKNEGMKAVLSSVGKVLKEISQAIKNFLREPVVLATIAIASMVYLIQSGLIPSLVNAASAAAKQASAFITEQITAFSNALRSTVVSTNLLTAATERLGIVQAIKGEYQGYQAALAAADTTTKALAGSTAASTASNYALAGSTAAATATNQGFIASLMSMRIVSAIQAQFTAFRATLAAMAVQVRSIDIMALSRSFLTTAVSATTATAATTQLTLSTLRLQIVQGITARFQAFQLMLTAVAAKMRAMDLLGFARYLVTSGTAARAASAGMAAFSQGVVATTAAVQGLIATLGPIALVVAGIAAAAEIINVVHSEFFAGNQILKDYKESLAELEEEVRKARNASGDDENKPTFNYEEEALKKIKSEQNAVSKVFRVLEDGTRKMVAAHTGIGVSRLREMGLVTNAERALNKQMSDQADLNVDIDSRMRSQGEEAGQLKQKLTDLVQSYNNGKVSEKDFTKQSGVLNDQIKANIGLLDGQIEKMGKMRGTTEEAEINIRSQEAALKALREQFEGLQNITIEQKKLPILGSQIDQLRDKAAQAEEAIKKGVGDPEIFAGKAKELVETSQQLFDMNIISEEEALRRLNLIATNTQLDTDTINSAQQAITKIIQSNSKEQLEIYESQKAGIQAQVKTGVITAVEGETQITEVVKQQGAERLRALDEEYNRTKRNREEQQRATVAGLESSITALKTEAANARASGANSRATAIEKEIAGLETKLTDTRTAYNEQAITSEKEYQAQRVKTQSETTVSIEESEERIYQARVKNLDRAAQKTIDDAKKVELDAQIEREKLIKSGQISREDADQQALNSTLTRNKAELQAEQDKLAALEKLPKLDDPEQEADRQEQIRQSRLKTKELTAQIMKDEEQAEKSRYDNSVKKLERAQDLALSKAKEIDAEYQIQTQELVNAGVIRKEEANRRNAASAINTTRTELQAEKDKLSALEKLPKFNDPVEEAERQKTIRDSRIKTKELTQRLLQEERELVEANIAALEEAQNDAAKAYTVELEKQVLALQKQEQLGNQLAKALAQRVELLRAEESLVKATSDYLASEFEILGQATKSEYRKQQIAQATAAIKYQSALIQNEYAMRSLMLEIEQNKIARDREETENRIAILRKQGELRQGEAEIKVAQEKYAANLITKAELDEVIIKQEGRYTEMQGLLADRDFIGQQRQNDERLNAIKIQQQQLQNNSNARQAQLGLAQSLPPGLRERALADLSNQIAKEFGFTNSRDLINSGVAMARQTARQAFPGAGSLQSNALSAFDPELEALNGRVSASQFSGAIADTRGRFGRQMGPAPFSAMQPGLLGAGAQPLRLPDILTTMPGGVRMNPTDLSRGFNLNRSELAPAGATTGLDRLAATVGSGGNRFENNFTITVSAQGGEDSAQATAKAVREQIQKVMDRAQEIQRQ
ncbi:MAG TPA: hypothetical protein V6D07_19030 [Trichocoleus sp.]